MSVSSKNVSLLELFTYFFRLSCTAFGGPLAYISMMEDDCVEKRKWIGKEEFTEMLGITNMLPGPNAAEMAIHIGYIKRGLAGAILSGIGFIAPSFIIILVLSWLYFKYYTIPHVEYIFYGINPVVVAIIFVAAYRLGRSSISNAKLLIIFVASFLLSYFTEVNEAIILIMMGFASLLLHRPRFKLSKNYGKIFVVCTVTLPFFSLTIENMPILVLIFLEFLKAGVLMFGSGLVILPLIGPDVINVFGWVTEKEFFDGITLGQITPGPVMKASAFIGYKVAGVWGALAAFLGVYLPPFIIVPIVSKSFRNIKDNAIVKDFLRGVEAGVVGTILAVIFSLSKVAFTDYLSILIAFTALILIIKFKVNVSLIVVVSGILGLFVKTFFI
ncbi:MAG: chromate efflux transporter [Nitrososphaeria archaeon]|nr:chromate efflux transporter [Nitrososphaeria archaeon]